MANRSHMFAYGIVIGFCFGLCLGLGAASYLLTGTVFPDPERCEVWDE